MECPKKILIIVNQKHSLCITLLSATMVQAWIYVSLSLVVISTVRGSTVCQHRDDIEHAVHGVYLEPHEHIAKRVANQPPRFTMYYDSSFYQLSSAIQNTLTTVMQQVTTLLGQTLQLKPLGMPILLDHQCATTYLQFINGIRYCAATCAASTMCGQVVVPASHLQVCRQCNGGGVSSCTQTGTAGAGVSNTDYILYVSAVSTSCGARLIAFATFCQTESFLDRPIAGNINFCPFAFTGGLSLGEIMSAVQHEALHALGFSSSLFALWRDQNGNPRTPRDPASKLPPVVNGIYQASTTTVMPLTYNNWVVSTGTISHQVTLLVTPNVLSAAQIYFNCPSLTGVELENQGGPLTALSHWEKRILGNELMTGEITFNDRLSVLTLAALQDTGWYQVNYSMAQPLVWGQNAGCLFAAGSCLGYTTSKLASGSSIDPFCNHYAMTPDLLGCTIDRAAVSYCNLIQYPTPLPTDYQYFPSLGSSYGGGDDLADYCPFQTIYNSKVCSNANNNPSTNYFAETYGPGSACVLQGSVGWSVNNVKALNTPGAGCYQYSYVNNSLAIEVLGTGYPCPTADQQINVSVTVNGFIYSGSLLCASYNQLSGGSITNPCSTNNGGCSQICTNTAGSFICSCTIGYALGTDSKMCYSTSLSGGKIAGIVIAVILITTILTLVIICFMVPLLRVKKNVTIQGRTEQESLIRGHNYQV